MKIVELIPIARDLINQAKIAGKSIALVPTMGNLHAGHLALITLAKQHADFVVVSIFVNPLQFNNPDDFANYPRTVQMDCETIAKVGGVDLIFAPSESHMYPYEELEEQTFIEVPGLSDMLEGANRPGHFRGVTTVVGKLFNIINPDYACFGEKDFQQLAIIKKMVRDLSFNVNILSLPTIRAEDGLALSSRNGLLTDLERETAPKLAEVMNQISSNMKEGELYIPTLLSTAQFALEQHGFIPDELFICDADTLGELTITSTHAVILMAATLGRARLIDNMIVELPVR
ncbi:pantoate--beta-alanine ligase [Thorsellia anophelis]|uniref:Pantothenate synthetase n=1 Tax=Thorsellia anophelis DSM 18579 TaxID=1123402 RepID=A0A1I0DC51_9GAMM|nr:pantoate--beta-alanine ligase [Thorsellia anophelis]SET29875.1 pantothenate synthetase [Thorsellia anophelis DSM 18579]